MRARKLNTLLLTAALLTTGGVYASWSYAEGTASELTIHRLVNIASETVSSPKGKINVVSNNLQFIVDEKPGDQYIAELKISGELVISFTPTSEASGTDPEVVAKGIPLKISISETYGLWDHDNDNSTAGIQVFEINESLNGHQLNGGDPIKSDFTILSNPSAADDDTNTKNVVEDEGVSLHISLADNIVLDTYDKYLSFKSYLEGENKEITITISEYTGA